MQDRPETQENIKRILSYLMRDDEDVVIPDDSDIPPLTHDTSRQFEALRLMIRKYEARKYPARLYDYAREKMVVNGVTMDAIHVKYKGGEPTEEESNDIINAGLVVRKLNIISSIIYALQFSPNYLNATQLEKDVIVEKLVAMMSEIIDPKLAAERRETLSPSAEMNEFIDQLVKRVNLTLDLDSKEDYDETLRKIRNAERYFVAANNKQRILIFESHINENDIYQIDIPIGNKLTLEQKKEFVKLHRVIEADRPVWFNQLAKWEQDWFTKNVPATIDDDWEEFESLFQSSAMQHIPGIKNARYNHLVSVDDHGKETILSKSLKAGTLVPYEMPLTQQEQVEAAMLTAEQALDSLQTVAIDNFTQLWGDIEGIKPLVLVQSLLSDTTMGGSDNQLTKIQRQAIESIMNKDKFSGIEIINGNEPENFLRLFAQQDSKRWEYADLVINYAHNFIDAIQDKVLSVEQRKQILIIQSALTELDNLKQLTSFTNPNDIIKRRNYEAFKVAYLGVLVEAMGGVVSTNCKSGKDRTGLDEIYRHAMLLYFEAHGELPAFKDDDENRQDFIKIFVDLFNTMKTHEAAAANTPGSFGLKDDAMMLCKDIARELGDSYLLSNKRAAINKPPLFTADEAKQAKQRKEFVKEEATAQKKNKAGLWDKAPKQVRAPVMKAQRRIKKRTKRALTTTRQMNTIHLFLSGDLTSIEELANTYTIKAEYAAKRGQATAETKAELQVAIDDCLKLKNRLDKILTDAYAQSYPNNKRYNNNVQVAETIKQKLSDTIMSFSVPLETISTFCNSNVCDASKVPTKVFDILHGDDTSSASITSNTDAIKSTPLLADNARVGSITLKDERPLRTQHYQLAVVQQYRSDGSFVTELHFKDEDLKRMGAKGSQTTGAKLIEEHIANPSAKFPIEINGNFPKKVVKEMILYCKANNYEYVNNTKYQFSPSTSSIEEAKKKYASEKTRREIFGERAKQLGKRNANVEAELEAKLPNTPSQSTT